MSDLPRTGRPQSTIDRCAPWLAAVAVVVWTAITGWLAVYHSPTPDELGHLFSGMTILETSEFDYYPHNPPFAKSLGAIPAWMEFPHPAALAEAVTLTRLTGDRFRDAPGHSPYEYGEKALRWLNMARCVNLLFYVLGAWASYQFASELYRPVAGLLACLMWLTSPNVIAYSSLFSFDAPLAAVTTLAAWQFWRWCCKGTWPDAVCAGGALGFALATKYSAVMLLPIWPFVWMLSRSLLQNPPRFSRSVLQGLTLAGVTLLTLNLTYGFRDTGVRLDQLRFYGMKTLASGNSRVAVVEQPFKGTVLGALPVPVPRFYIEGTSVQRADFGGAGFGQYLRGEKHDKLIWWFFLYAIAVKEPVGSQLLCLAAIGSTLALIVRVLRRRSPESDRALMGERAVAGVLNLTVAFSLLILVSAHFQYFARYLLPMAPMLYVLCGGLLMSSRRSVHAVCWLLVLANVISVARQHPAYQGYFNELAGGPQYGGFHLNDCNVDWGQDTIRLIEWAKKHPDRCPMNYYIYGSSMPSLGEQLTRVVGTDLDYGFFMEPPRIGNPVTYHFDKMDLGWYAISRIHTGKPLEIARANGNEYFSTHYNIPVPFFNELTPVESVGSIDIFHITPVEIEILKKSKYSVTSTQLTSGQLNGAPVNGTQQKSAP